MLVVGAGGINFNIFSLVYHFSFSFSLSLAKVSIYTEIVSQRATKPKTIHQQTNVDYYELSGPPA